MAGPSRQNPVQFSCRTALPNLQCDPRARGVRWLDTHIRKALGPG
jgi:hypothetical protein